MIGINNVADFLYMCRYICWHDAYSIWKEFVHGNMFKIVKNYQKYQCSMTQASQPHSSLYFHCCWFLAGCQACFSAAWHKQGSHIAVSTYRACCWLFGRLPRPHLGMFRLANWLPLATNNTSLHISYQLGSRQVGHYITLYLDILFISPSRNDANV